ncbi:thioesterase family protein [Streptomyces sp. NPDC026672]|uniref:thioesterase family protein n=1 Tax=unclassified Streptomyces TaxID=2593676 RepID=UPI00340CF0B7
MGASPVAPAGNGLDPRWRPWTSEHAGRTAAVALAAVRDHFAGGAHPVRSLTTHFLAPVGASPLYVSGVAPAVGPDTVTCVFDGHQDDSPVLVGSAVLGPGRTGPSYEGLRAPAGVPEPEDCPHLDLPAGPAPFAEDVEVRPVAPGPLPADGRPELLAWVQFSDGRPLDTGAVVTLADVLPPALHARRPVRLSAQTAELSVHFTDVLDTNAPRGWALVRARTEQAGAGWCVDGGEVWSSDGRLLALARRTRVLREEPPAPRAA